jgi:NAD(P)-dependent dehydrogenase (short-subunit alcohol dehydrogenase family)
VPVEAAGDLDVLVNNAATVEPLGRTTGLDPAQVQRALTLNVVMPMALTGLLVPAMAHRGWGRVVNVSSGVAIHPAGMIGGGTYAATKAALEAHTTNLAAELDGTGVTVNAYRPGTVDTSMQRWLRTRDTAEVGQELHDTFQGYHDDGKLITPQQSAGQLVDHLAGDVVSGEIWSIRR